MKTAMRAWCLETRGWLDTGDEGIAGSELQTGFWSCIEAAWASVYKYQEHGGLPLGGRG